MVSEQSTNIIIAFVVIIIVVGFSIKILLTYLKYKKLQNNTVFPPWPATCPDYWAVGDNEGECKNIYKIGDCMTGDGADGVMNFGEPIFKGGKGPFYKCSWSKKCRAPWEGIDSLC